VNTLELPFADASSGEAIRLGEGIALLRGFGDTAKLMPLINGVANAAPFRHLVTPGGQTMSVAMTNCGPVGWVSDRSGYRYSSRDPLTDRTGRDAARVRRSRWTPPRPAVSGLRARRLSHQPLRAARGSPRIAMPTSRTSRSPSFRYRWDCPRASRSTGSRAAARARPWPRRWRRARLGWPSRLVYHAVRPIKPGLHPLTGAFRYNLTFRHAR
jgi:alkylated DNA repair protein (DNA oxidative demethylase)